MSEGSRPGPSRNFTRRLRSSTISTWGQARLSFSPPEQAASARASTARSAAAPPRAGRPLTAPRSQLVVRAVAERLAGGRLAAAQPDLAGCLGLEHHRGEAGALMGAVAEGLRRAAPAGAPEIFLAGLDHGGVRRLLGRNGS